MLDATTNPGKPIVELDKLIAYWQWVKATATSEARRTYAQYKIDGLKAQRQHYAALAEAEQK